MILLDTHVLVWWVAEPERLSAKARRAIAGDGAEGILVSSISAWEIGMLVKKGRLKLSMNVRSWLALTERLPRVRYRPVTNEIALASALLPAAAPRDPADGIIIATAMAEEIPLVTADARIRKCRLVRTVW